MMEEESKRQEQVIAKGRAFQAELQRLSNKESAERIAQSAEILKQEERIRSLQWQVGDLQRLIEGNKAVIEELKSQCSSMEKIAEENARYSSCCSRILYFYHE